jgi:hypothetical protein
MYANGLQMPLFEEGADKVNMAVAH